ncbi:MAG: metallophosphoesterase [Candidatus Hadarchaeales archaeon]
MFLDRYEKLSRIFKRSGVPSVPLSRVREGEECWVVGMVAERKQTARGNLLLVLEDPTGTLRAVITKNNGIHLPLDSVIAVRGRKGEGSSLFLADEILFPDLPPADPVPAGFPGVAVVSDLHVGSQMFLEGLWRSFCSWLGENRWVRHLILAGDLVDGIGIYPGQEEELAVPDIYGQFARLAELLELVPEGVEIYAIPGNHDYLPALPQPPLPKDLASPLYERGVRMLGDPARLEIEGVRILVFHGHSFDSLGGDFNRPLEMMKLLLVCRHLAPSYGLVPLRPGERDELVVEEVPHVFVTGHTHVSGVGRYKNTLLISAGCFQDETEYTRMHGIHPTPGDVVILKNGSVSVKSFGGGGP